MIDRSNAKFANGSGVSQVAMVIKDPWPPNLCKGSLHMVVVVV